MSEDTTEPKRRRLPIFLLALPTLLVLVFFYTQLLTTAPVSFSPDTRFEVPQGMSVRAIAQKAQEEGLVRSDVLLYAALTRQHDPTNIFAGEYVFSEPQNVFDVARKLASGDIVNETVSVTFPEGITLKKMAEIAAQSLLEFDADEYLALTAGMEGRFFPETYFVPLEYTASDLITLQQETYEGVMAPLRDAIAQSTLTEDQVLILASIVEREANDEESMGYVAGVFLNRIEIGMPLQADASIEYVLDTPLNELPPGQLASELRETDSPYNTYLNPGLPPTPIGNPGRTAIDAVVTPTPSEYFYYITGSDGTFYYASTLQEHNMNIANHLR